MKYTLLLITVCSLVIALAIPDAAPQDLNLRGDVGCSPQLGAKDPNSPGAVNTRVFWRDGDIPVHVVFREINRERTELQEVRVAYGGHYLVLLGTHLGLYDPAATVDGRAPGLFSRHNVLIVRLADSDGGMVGVCLLFIKDGKLISREYMHMEAYMAQLEARDGRMDTLSEEQALLRWLSERDAR